MRIASVVTSAPRFSLEPTDEPNVFRRGAPVSYLPQTLDSLRLAGFSPSVHNDDQLSGSYPALLNALRCLLVTEPEADAILVVQDDVLVAKGLAAWLEVNLWPRPEEQIGVVSLYCATPNHLRRGWFTLDDLPVYRPFGALCLAFPRHSAERLVADPPNRAFRTGSDTSVATFCRREKLSYFLHSPSLIEHQGIVSAIHDHRGSLIPERCAGNFCEDCTALTPATILAHSPGHAAEPTARPDSCADS